MAKSERAVEKPQSATTGEVSLTIELDEQAAPKPIRDQIEHRAYAIYLERGCQDGFDVQDWLQAESELLSTAEGKSSRAKAVAA